MNAKLLFPPPLASPLPEMSTDPSKKNSTRTEVSNGNFKLIGLIKIGNFICFNLPFIFFRNYQRY